MTARVWKSGFGWSWTRSLRTSLALTGQQGSRMAEIADHVIRAPATRTNSIREMHIVIGHMLCGFIEEALC